MAIILDPCSVFADLPKIKDEGNGSNKSHVLSKAKDDLPILKRQDKSMLDCDASRTSGGRSNKSRHASQRF